MPERKGSRRIETTELQGQGSYVVVRALTYGQRRVAQDMFLRASGGTLPTKADAVPEIKIDAQYLQDNDVFTAKLLSENVIEWNWVDDQGNPLPLPKDDPNVIDNLTAEETEFLVRAINPSRAEAAAKN